MSIAFGFGFAFTLLALSGLVGCTPGIGDKCALSTDCSATGTLVCDTSQPDGYCTQLNCTNSSCPGGSLCVLFQPSVPGCAYNDYQSPARTGRSFCMKDCSEDSTCRQSEGYVCRNPTAAPWYGAILDNNQTQSVCIVEPSLFSAAVADNDAAVCQPYDADAGATSSDGGLDGGVDGAPSQTDGGSAEAGDGGGATGDSGTDAEVEGPADTGSADAPGGG